MDSNTELLLTGVLIAGLGGMAGVQYWREGRMEQGGVPPLPKNLIQITDRQTVRISAANVKQHIAELRQLPWGQAAGGSPHESQNVYNQAIAICSEAQGEHQKLAPAIELFLQCPPPLAYSGAAEILQRLSFLRNRDYIALGLREAGRYTSLAIASDPASADAWIERMRVFSLGRDRVWNRIAQYAFEQARKLAPDHPRLALAEASFYRSEGMATQREAALLTALDMVPTKPERRGVMDSLALLYLEQNRLDESIAMFQRATDEFPDTSAWLWHNYSVALNKAKRYQEALVCSDRALSFYKFPVALAMNIALRKKLGLPVPVGA